MLLTFEDPPANIKVSENFLVTNSRDTPNFSCLFWHQTSVTVGFTLLFGMWGTVVCIRIVLLGEVFISWLKRCEIYITTLHCSAHGAILPMIYGKRHERRNACAQSNHVSTVPKQS